MDAIDHEIQEKSFNKIIKLLEKILVEMRENKPTQKTRKENKK